MERKSHQIWKKQSLILLEETRNFFMKKLVLLLLSFFLLCCAQQSESDDSFDFIARVISVSDGDTIKVLKGKEQIKIRLQHIDCPEKKQPYGDIAKRFTSQMVFNKQVKVINKGEKDRWGRLLGVIHTLEGVSLNKELVKNGLALHYRKYSKDSSYSQLETQARKNKTGMWSNPNLIEPWVFRKRKSNK